MLLPRQTAPVDSGFPELALNFLPSCDLRLLYAVRFFKPRERALMSEKTATIGNLAKIFGLNTFNQKAMREKLPRDVFDSLVRTIEAGQKMDPAIVPTVAHAMKEWAMERGATHY